MSNYLPTNAKWRALVKRAQEDAEVFEIIDLTLRHAQGVARRTRPAANSLMTFEGGRRRVVGLLRNLRLELRGGR